MSSHDLLKYFPLIINILIRKRFCSNCSRSFMTIQGLSTAHLGVARRNVQGWERGEKICVNCFSTLLVFTYFQRIPKFLMQLLCKFCIVLNRFLFYEITQYNLSPPIDTDSLVFSGKKKPLSSHNFWSDFYFFDACFSTLEEIVDI